MNALYTCRVTRVDAATAQVLNAGNEAKRYVTARMIDAFSRHPVCLYVCLSVSLTASLSLCVSLSVCGDGWDDTINT